MYKCCQFGGSEKLGHSLDAWPGLQGSSEHPGALSEAPIVIVKLDLSGVLPRVCSARGRDGEGIAVARTSWCSLPSRWRSDACLLPHFSPGVCMLWFVLLYFVFYISRHFHVISTITFPEYLSCVKQ